MSAAVPIVKMSGAGNDFVVLDAAAAKLVGGELTEWARRVCRRGLSVGADGVLVVSRLAPDRVSVRFLNPDGSEVFCGNGSRCAARFAVLRGMARSVLTLQTAIGEVPASVTGESVRLTLPLPEDRGPAAFERDGGRIEGRMVFAGVPHFVAFVADLTQAPLADWGPWLRAHPHFGPQGTNVNLARWFDRDTIELRTWERGVEGETLSCGSGALAAALVAAGASGAGRIRVLPASGVALAIEIAAPDDPLRATLTGDARVIFEGRVPAEGVSGFPNS